MSRIFALAIVAASLVPQVRLPAQDTAIPKDLQGSWDVVSITTEGKLVKPLARSHWRFTFREGKYLMRKTGMADQVFDVVVHEQKDPKQIDLVSSERKVEGLYKIDATSMTIMMPLDSKRGRPVDFDAAEGVEIVQLRKAPDPGDEIPVPDLTPAKPRRAADKDGVEGRWELITDKMPKGESTKIRLEFALAKKALKIQSESTGSFFGLTTKNNSNLDVAFVADPEGMPGLLIIPIDDGKKQTLQIISYRFRDDILELYGEIVAPYVRANVTGQYRRLTVK